ncbi:TPA: hypothetical protein ACXZJW_004047 [Salmonella enterica]
MKCDTMFSPSGAFPGVDAIIGDRSPAMVMKPRHNKALAGCRIAAR